MNVFFKFTMECRRKRMKNFETLKISRKSNISITQLFKVLSFGATDLVNDALFQFKHIKITFIIFVACFSHKISTVVWLHLFATFMANK